MFSDSGEGLCLLDLDTIGQLSLAYEMGDALRHQAGKIQPGLRLSPHLQKRNELGDNERQMPLQRNEARGAKPGHSES